LILLQPGQHLILPAAFITLLAGCSRSPIQAVPEQPPHGGRKLLHAAVAATTAVVGRISESKRLDHAGYQATLLVEQSLSGSLAKSDRVRIGWEELSASRPVRFKDGDRVIVALAPLPSASLWRSRFPDAGTAHDVYVVLAEGEAFVAHPDPDSISCLETYIRLSPEARRGAEGENALAAILRRAAPDLAVAAAQALIDLDGPTPLPEAAQEDLSEALRLDRSPALQPLIIEIAARYRAIRLRAQLQSLGDSDADLGFAALMAVAAIDGSTADERVTALLSDANPMKRRVGVHLARGSMVEPLLPLLRSDSDPKVRAAAAQALIEQRGSSAMTEVLRGLADPDLFVRTESARALGRLGAAVVPALVDIARTSSPDAAQAAVLALESTGTAGVDALHDLAENHPEPSVRRLAKIAMGKLEDPH